MTTVTQSLPATVATGYLAIVLHAHLPFVRHPEAAYMMEENWLYEAMTETYLPLIALLNNLDDDHIATRLTLSLTPPLCAMLNDDLLKERYSAHLRRLIELSEKEIDRTKGKKQYNATAHCYHDRFMTLHHLFHSVLDGNLIRGFRDLQDNGTLEIITCGATHGYFPTMQHNPNAVHAQLAVAVHSYESFFGRTPAGIWLPECGYYPGLAPLLHKNGIRYFFTETHGIQQADPTPQHGVYAPIYCSDAPVAVFARDPESSRAVWSAEEGYPGDPAYRDFYRDIGFDLDIDYIRPYIDPIGIRITTGIKYHRITGKNRQKLPYDHLDAMRVAAGHAGNFMFNREQQARYLASMMDRPPIIVAPYDAELFGHWWYEGPLWLNYLIRKLAFEQDCISLITPSDYLEQFPENQIATPSFSSWGEGGYSEVWLHESNDWIYRHLHHMEELMVSAAQTHTTPDDLERRALNQMARELLLAQSSDWAFIMKQGTMVNYAVRRTREHIASFLRLHDDLQNRRIDPNFVTLLESHNNIFPDINYAVYA